MNENLSVLNKNPEPPVTEATPQTENLSFDADQWVKSGVTFSGTFYPYNFNIKVSTMVRAERGLKNVREGEVLSEEGEALVEEIFDTCLDLPDTLRTSVPPFVKMKIVGQYLSILYNTDLPSPLPKGSSG